MKHITCHLHHIVFKYINYKIKCCFQLTGINKSKNRESWYFPLFLIDWISSIINTLLTPYRLQQQANLELALLERGRFYHCPLVHCQQYHICAFDRLHGFDPGESFHRLRTEVFALSSIQPLEGHYCETTGYLIESAAIQIYRAPKAHHSGIIPR